MITLLKELVGRADTWVSVLNVLLVGAVAYIVKWAVERLISDNASLKHRLDEVVAKISTHELKLFAHTQTMSTLNGDLATIKHDLLHQVASIKAYLGSVEQEIKSLEHSITLKSQVFEQQLSFIANLRRDLEQLHGNITRLDKDTEGLTIKVDLAQNKISAHNMILKTHNEWMKKLKANR